MGPLRKYSDLGERERERESERAREREREKERERESKRERERERKRERETVTLRQLVQIILLKLVLFLLPRVPGSQLVPVGGTFVQHAIHCGFVHLPGIKPPPRSTGTKQPT